MKEVPTPSRKSVINEDQEYESMIKNQTIYTDREDDKLRFLGHSQSLGLIDTNQVFGYSTQTFEQRICEKAIIRKQINLVDFDQTSQSAQSNQSS